MSGYSPDAGRFAAQVAFDPTGLTIVTADDVQDALEELDAGIDDLPELDTSDAGRMSLSTAGGVTTMDVDNLMVLDVGATQTSNFSAVAGTAYAIDCTGGAVTMTLPSAPTHNTICGAFWRGGSAGVTIARGGGDTIDGNTTLTMLFNGGCVLLQYDDPNNLWRQLTPIEASRLLYYASVFAPNAETVGTGLATTGTINLDMSTLHGSIQTITLTGDPTFTTSNKAAGKRLTLVLAAGGSTRTITWPAWTAYGAALPTSLASGKSMIVDVFFTSTTEASGRATAAVEP